MSFRHRCGECAYSTNWGAESVSTEAMLDHYRTRHPDVLPGGIVEYRENGSHRGRGGGGPGFLAILGALVLVCLVLGALKDCR